jgi:1-acyl-sn-glycerol-3-phosphate acyltransferase
MKTTLALVRILFMVCLVLCGLLFGILAAIIPQRVNAVAARWWHRATVWIFGVKIEYAGETDVYSELLVANHVSWLDIPIIGSRFPVIFLANQDIAGWPVLGYVIRKGGTLFINRGEGAAGAIEKISNSLACGQSVMLFPEGKTTDGSSTAKFHPRLFQAALDSGSGVRPISIRYLDKHGARTDRTEYVGETTFLQSLWRIACTDQLQAKVTVFEVLENADNRNEYASQAEFIIRNDIQKQIKSAKIS